MELVTLLVIAFSLAVLQNVGAFDAARCIGALGLESGAIKDEDIRASSSFENGSVGPQNARVRQERLGGAWCPNQPTSHEPSDWLEVNLKTTHVLTSIETQGRFGNGQGQEFAEHFMMDYWRDSLGKWIRYKDYKGEEILKGNTNTYTPVKQDLDPPIFATKVRFFPYSHHVRMVCMRVELYGCPWNDGIISYSMPQGDQRGSSWNFYDSSYDGFWDGSLLKQGLGQLTDGRLGPENFKATYYERDKAQNWIGWRNDTRNGNPIEVTFEFDAVRDFSSLTIYASNQFTKDVQVFSELQVMFSVDGKLYLGEAIVSRPAEDRIFEQPKNITVKLHQRFGKFVKLRLSFASKWMLLSEITFKSELSARNYTTDGSEAAVAQKELDKGNSERDDTVQNDSNGPTDPESQTYLAVIIGVLVALSLMMAAAIFFIVFRHRNGKSLTGSPLPSKNGWPLNRTPLFENEYHKQNGTVPYDPATTQLLVTSSGESVLVKSGNSVYQEPFYPAKPSPYYSYSTLMARGPQGADQLYKDGSDTYEYAVPEVQGTPLVRHTSRTRTLPCNELSTFVDQPRIGPMHNSLMSRVLSTTKSCPTDSPSKKTCDKAKNAQAFRAHFEKMVVPDVNRSNIQLHKRIASGAFGTIYVADAIVPDYASDYPARKKTVAAKFLPPTSAKDKSAFLQEVQMLAALDDPNICRVLGLCATDEPFCVLLEFLEYGDLTQFLKSKCFAPDLTMPKPDTIRVGDLVYICCQIASGMRFLESLNFVHRDLATRNCIIGANNEVKICDFGTDSDVYEEDYYRPEGQVHGLPIRWMAWEPLIQGKYTTKSDVWSFAVTMWEVLTLARNRPFSELEDSIVLRNLHMVSRGETIMQLSKPNQCPREMYELMSECWKRSSSERPTFREIHLFLQRKHLSLSQ